MAAQKEEFRDVHPIPGVPESPNTVKWAEDGTIAVAAGNTITLVHPNRFGNAVGLAIGGDAPRANQPITAPGEPAQGQSNIHFDLTLSTRIMASTASVKPSVRAIAWSPLGCATQGTCLLAAVSDDHHVHIYGPTCSLSPEWACLSSLMDGVVDHLKQSDWADVDAGGQAPAEDPGTLRLRGGARGKQPAIRSSTADAVVRKVADDADNTEAAAARGDGTGAASGSAAAPAAKRRKSSAPQQASAGDAIDAAVQRRGPLGPEAGVPVLDFQGQERLPRIIAGLAAAQYFFALRRREDPDDLPDYPQPSTHIKDRDLELLEEATAAVWAVNADVLEAAGILKPVLDKECRIQMRFAWDRMNNTMKSGFEYMGLPGGKQVEASSEESTDDSSEEELGDDGGPAQRAERRARREALVEPPTQAQGAAAPAAPQPVFSREPYAVPEEFTWRDLPPVDPANRSTLRRTLVEGSVRRFLALRREEPAELLPRYEASNVHLRGVDAWLVERVNKEYTSAHAAGLEALGYDAKKFANYWSQR